MQFLLDFDRRSACADTNDQILYEIGVSPVQRGVVYLLWVNENAKRFQPENRELKIMEVTLTNVAAADWLRSNFGSCRGLRLSASTFRKAAEFWLQLGILQLKVNRKTRFLLSFGLLSQWVSSRQTEDAELLNGFSHVSGRVPACADVSGHVPSVIDGLSFNKSFQSINPEIFAGLDGSAWEIIEGDEGRESRRLYRLLRAWWNEYAEQIGLPLDHVLGAILAARTGKTDPERYALKCLANEVKQNWINRAAAWRKRLQSELSYQDYTAR